MRAFVLSDEDRMALRRMLDREQQRSRNTPSRPSAERSWADAQDFEAPEVYIAWPATEDGIPAMVPVTGTGTGTDEYDLPGSAVCDIYKISTLTGRLAPVEGLSKRVYNVSGLNLPQQWTPIARTKYGKWLALPVTGLVRCCLKENHPGKGIEFDVYLGVWDPASDSWDYGTPDNPNRVVKAIDWWWSDTGPYPAAGATGKFVPRPSNAYGLIYECVSMDCDSPGPCLVATGTGS